MTFHDKRPGSEHLIHLTPGPNMERKPDSKQLWELHAEITVKATNVDNIKMTIQLTQMLGGVVRMLRSKIEICNDSNLIFFIFSF